MKRESVNFNKEYFCRLLKTLVPAITDEQYSLLVRGAPLLKEYAAVEIRVNTREKEGGRLRNYLGNERDWKKNILLKRKAA